MSGHLADMSESQRSFLMGGGGGGGRAPPPPPPVQQYPGTQAQLAPAGMAAQVSDSAEVKLLRVPEMMDGSGRAAN